MVLCLIIIIIGHRTCSQQWVIYGIWWEVWIIIRYKWITRKTEKNVCYLELEYIIICTIIIYCTKYDYIYNAVFLIVEHILYSISLKTFYNRKIIPKLTNYKNLVNFSSYTVQSWKRLMTTSIIEDGQGLSFDRSYFEDIIFQLTQ